MARRASMLTIGRVKWLAPSILSAAAAWLAVAWDRLPARWVTHWGVGGRPNGFTTKTPLGVFGLLLLGAAVYVSFEVILLAARRKPSVPASSMALGTRIVETSVAIVLAATSLWLPLAQPTSPLSFIVFTVAVIGVGLAGAIHLSARDAKQLVARGADEDGWQGLVYRNPKDERLWVPKRFGWGMTINFAHPSAWSTLLLLMSPALLILVTVLFLTMMRH